MLFQARTMMLLAHGALSAGLASCRPVDGPVQRTRINHAADAA